MMTRGSSGAGGRTWARAGRSWVRHIDAALDHACQRHYSRHIHAWHLWPAAGRAAVSARHAARPTSIPPLVDLETRQLRMLVAIADEGTVTRAAATLNVSQPA